MDKRRPSAPEAKALREIIDGIERRRERRTQASDVVYLVVGLPRPQLVEAKLVDLSSGGFRAVHDHMRLAAGDSVRFFQTSSSGTAVAIWSRISGGSVETGFQIVDKQDTRESAIDGAVEPPTG